MEEEKKVLEIIQQFKKIDKNYLEHLEDLLLLAQNLPTQYTLATMSLEFKVKKYKNGRK